MDRLLRGIGEVSITGRGVPAGANRPNQRLVSKWGMPASAMVGRSGSAPERLLAATASGLSLPAAIWPTTVEAGENVHNARPAMTSVTVCGLP